MSQDTNTQIQSGELTEQELEAISGGGYTSSQGPYQFTSSQGPYQYCPRG